MSMPTTHEGTKDWCITKPPEFPAGVKAFVLPGAFYGAIVGLMAESGFQKADDVESADVVVFGGGADINPALYGEKNVAAYGISHDRDEFEVSVYKSAVELGKVCFGICRGAQFLHAMNGGKLWQHVNNHGGSDHSIIDIDEDVRVVATSLHHQMLQENETMELVAVTERAVATNFKDATTDVTIGRVSAGNKGSTILEVEAGAYSDTRCFFVQGHPEIGSPEYRSWTMTRLLDFYLEWTQQTRQISDVLKTMA